MFCSNCGSQLPEGRPFCQVCGAKVTDGENAVYQAERPDQLKKTSLVWKVEAVIGIILVIVFCLTIHRPEKDARDAYIDYYKSSVTAGDVFDFFFENGKWSEYKENGDTYVVYAGDCCYLGGRVNVKIRFRIGENCFYFAAVEIKMILETKGEALAKM